MKISKSLNLILPNLTSSGDQIILKKQAQSGVFDLSFKKLNRPSQTADKAPIPATSPPSEDAPVGSQPGLNFNNPQASSVFNFNFIPPVNAPDNTIASSELYSPFKRNNAFVDAGQTNSINFMKSINPGAFANQQNIQPGKTPITSANKPKNGAFAEEIKLGKSNLNNAIDKIVEQALDAVFKSGATKAASLRYKEAQNNPQGFPFQVINQAPAQNVNNNAKARPFQVFSPYFVSPWPYYGFASPFDPNKKPDEDKVQKLLDELDQRWILHGDKKAKQQADQIRARRSGGSSAEDMENLSEEYKAWMQVKMLKAQRANEQKKFLMTLNKLKAGARQANPELIKAENDFRSVVAELSPILAQLDEARKRTQMAFQNYTQGRTKSDLWWSRNNFLYTNSYDHLREAEIAEQQLRALHKDKLIKLFQELRGAYNRAMQAKLNQRLGVDPFSTKIQELTDAWEKRSNEFDSQINAIYMRYPGLAKLQKMEDVASVLRTQNIDPAAYNSISASYRKLVTDLMNPATSKRVAFDTTPFVFNEAKFGLKDNAIDFDSYLNFQSEMPLIDDPFVSEKRKYFDRLAELVPIAEIKGPYDPKSLAKAVASGNVVTVPGYAFAQPATGVNAINNKPQPRYIMLSPSAAVRHHLSPLMRAVPDSAPSYDDINFDLNQSTELNFDVGNGNSIKRNTALSKLLGQSQTKLVDKLVNIAVYNSFNNKKTASSAAPTVAAIADSEKSDSDPSSVVVIPENKTINLTEMDSIMRSSFIKPRKRRKKQKDRDSNSDAKS